MTKKLPTLGADRLQNLREQMAERRAINESKSIAPYTDDDMQFEPLDADMAARVKKVSRKDR